MSNNPVATPTVLHPAEGLWIRQAVDVMGWADLGEYAIIVDALEQHEEKDDVLSAIDETLGDQPVRYLVNTHTHYDHIALNEVFAQRWGLEIVNLQTREIPPEGEWFDAGDRKMQLVPMAGCHTGMDLLVWLPESRCLFVGDLFNWGVLPISGVLNDDSFQTMSNIFDRLLEFDAEIVVPGHGPVATGRHLQRFIRYAVGLRRAICTAVADGQENQQIAKLLPAPADMGDWWRFEQWKHADNISKITEAVRAGRLHSLEKSE